ncbi:MAG: hypothetical protein K2J16_01365, partial [Clostridia bacterium]|nr:hypothetical protein [Clostridia bacterium]
IYYDKATENDLAKIKRTKYIYRILFFLNLVPYIVVCFTGYLCDKDLSGLLFIVWLVAIAYALIIFCCMNSSVNKINKSIKRNWVKNHLQTLYATINEEHSNNDNNEQAGN